MSWRECYSHKAILGFLIQPDVNRFSFPFLYEFGKSCLPSVAVFPLSRIDTDIVFTCRKPELVEIILVLILLLWR